MPRILANKGSLKSISLTKNGLLHLTVVRSSLYDRILPGVMNMFGRIKRDNIGLGTKVSQNDRSQGI